MKKETHSNPIPSVKNTITISANMAFPTLRKGKAFKILLFFADKIERNLVPGAVHEMPLSFARNLMGIKDLNNDQLGVLLAELEELKFDWASYDVNSTGFSHVISSCRFMANQDVLYYSFDSQFVKEYQHPAIPFKNLSINMLMGFRSNYALKLYELAFQYYDPKRQAGKTPTYSKEDLFKILSINPSRYNQGSGQWSRDAIKKPLEEVNEISDCLVEFHASNTRGKNIRYWFSVCLHPQKKFNLIPDSNVQKEMDSVMVEQARLEEDACKLASLFLEYFKDDLVKLFTYPFTQAERKTYLGSLEQDPPKICWFTHELLLDGYMKISADRKEEWLRVVTEAGLY